MRDRESTITKLIEWELESISDCDFNAEEEKIAQISELLKSEVGDKPVVTLGLSFPVTDAFLVRAGLPKSISQTAEFNTALYKSQTLDKRKLKKMTVNLPRNFIIIDEFSFSGRKILTATIRLLRLGVTDFTFITLVGDEGVSLEQTISYVEASLDEEDKLYLAHHRQEIMDRMKVLFRDNSLLKKLGVFTNIVRKLQAVIEGFEVQNSEIYRDQNVLMAIFEKLNQIKKSD